MNEKEQNRTIVGVPFYDGEGLPVLEACLSDIDHGLNNLAVDAKIVVGINGPMVCMGSEPLSKQVNKSKYNADITFVKTLPGQVASLNQIARIAVDEGVGKIFLTDADISRMPDVFTRMWNEGERPLVGVKYSAYPVEIMLDAGCQLSEQEIALINIFEADKHPLVRNAMGDLRPNTRVKGSLMLVDSNLASRMHGFQKTTPDSRMNFHVGEDARQVLNSTGFFHYPRVDLEDHMRARLRHYKAAASENRQEMHHRKELSVTPDQIENIAKDVLSTHPFATEQVSNLLLRTALRIKVATTCNELARGKVISPTVYQSEVDWKTPVHNYREAESRIESFMAQVDWSEVQSPTSNGNGTTQNNARIPIDLSVYAEDPARNELLRSYLGVEKKNRS